MRPENDASALDLPPLCLGEVVRPLADDDLLQEMLDAEGDE